MKTLDNRRSIRKYSDRDVPEKLVSRLLTEAERTQTMGNLQLYSVVVTRDEKMKARLAEAHFNQPMVTGAPVVLTFCADYRRTSVWAENRNAAPGYGNFMSFVNAATDALLYCQTFCNLADEEGMGYCFLGTTIYNPQMIVDILKLPQLVMPIATITLGWPDENPQQTDRLPIEAIVHDETFHDYTPESIDLFYAGKEALPESKAAVAENGKQTLAQVFTDCRYTKKDNEAISARLIETLKQQGFIK